MAGSIPKIGHNSGRVDELGKSWRRHVWAKARRDLMPNLPIEVIRRRVARAKELGLPYKTYAGLRAASGDDLIGFMFSSNALDLLRAADRVPAAKVAKLDALRDAKTVGLAILPIAPEHLTPPLQSAYAAPDLLAPWAQTRAALRTVFAQTGHPPPAVSCWCAIAIWNATGCRQAAWLAPCPPPIILRDRPMKDNLRYPHD
jgi:hypothetical protein